MSALKARAQNRLVPQSLEPTWEVLIVCGTESFYQVKYVFLHSVFYLLRRVG